MSVKVKEKENSGRQINESHNRTIYDSNGSRTNISPKVYPVRGPKKPTPKRK